MRLQWERDRNQIENAEALVRLHSLEFGSLLDQIKMQSG